MNAKNEQSKINRRYGYIRVSSKEQNLARQQVEMQKLNLAYIFEEKASGKNVDRPELQKMLNILSEGDTVVVLSIDRLARNTKDLLELVDLFKKKGINFISLKENIDTSTPTGMFIITILGALSELEREYIRERQRQGIAIAKTQKKYKGRRERKIPGLEEMTKRMRSGNMSVEEASKLLGISRSTYYRKLKKLEALDNEVIDF